MNDAGPFAPLSDQATEAAVATLMARADAAAGLRLNLGCGHKAVEGYVGVDIGEARAAEVKADVGALLRRLPDASVAALYTRHFLEHVAPPDLLPLLAQMDRVLRPGGRLRVIVPHFSNPFFYSDPTHRQAFGVHTFSYLCERSCLRREVPRYAAIRGWSLERVRLGFVPWKRLRLLGIKLPMPSDLLNAGLRRSTLATELFERYLCWVLPIYEVEYEIAKAGASGGTPQEDRS